MNKIYFLIIFSFLFSCNESKINFIKLEKHSGEGIFDRDSIQGKKFIYQSYLIDGNLPDKIKFEPILFNMNKKEYLKELSDKGTIQFSMQFYKKNATTAYFIENADDPGGFSSYVLTDYFEREGIAEVYINKINDKKCYREIRLPNEEEFRVIDTIDIN